MKSMKSKTLSLAVGAVVACLAFLATSPLQADDFEWLDPGGSTFTFPFWKNVTTNAFPAGPPGASDTAIFDLGAVSPYTMTFVSGVTTNQLIIRNDDLVFNLGTFTYNVTSVVTVGQSASETANLFVENGTLASGGNLTVGLNAGSTGTLTLQNGGQASSVNGILGLGSTSNGAATVNGAGTRWDNSGNLGVGGFGTGTLNVQGGGIVTNVDGVLASFGPAGTATVEGAGSQWINSGSLYLGGSSTGGGGTGTLTVQDNAGVTVTDTLKIWNTGSLTIDGGTVLTGSFDHTSGGTFNFNKGALTVSGGTFDQGLSALVVDGAGAGDQAILNLISGATTANVQEFRIGDSNQGALVIAAGSQAVNTAGRIGYAPSSVGMATVAGAGSAWTNSSLLQVGRSGSGTLDVSAGGQVSSTSGNIGQFAGGGGTVTVNGSGSSWTTTSSMNVGISGSGTLNVLDGGQVSTTNGADGNIAGNSSSTGTVIVDGVGSRWTNTGSLYIGGQSSGAGGTGSLAVQDNGDVDVASTLKIWNAGTLTIDGGAVVTQSFNHTSGGTFNFNDGSLTVDGGTFDQGVVNLDLSGAAPGDLPTLNIINGAATANVLNATIGDVNQGALNISSGGQVISAFGLVGVNSGSNGVATVNGAGSAWNNSDALTIGVVGTGTLNVQNGGLVTNTNGGLGLFGDSVGTATVTGTNSMWTNSSSLYLGGGATDAGGTGSLTVRNSGAVTVADTLKIWTAGTLTVDGGSVTTGSFDHTSAGTFTFDDGSLTVTDGTFDQGAVDLVLDGTGAGDLPTLNVINGASTANVQEARIGNANQGALNIQSGGTVANTFGYVGYDAGSNGTATVDGTGSLWTNTDSLYLGGNTSAAGGSGSLTVQNGGAVTVGDTLKIWSSGALTIDGGAVTTGSFDDTSGGSFTFDDGSLTVDGGTFDQGAATLVLEGRGPGNLPTLNLINGATAANVQDVRIGNFNSGALNIQSGGQLSNATGFLGAGAGSGDATVDGAGSAWTNSGSLYIGGSNSLPSSAGTVTVQDNGALNVGDTLKIWGPGTLTINGGDVVTQHFDHTSGGTFTFRGGSLTVDGGTFDQGPSNLLLAGFVPGDPPTLNVINGATTANVQQIRIGVLDPGALNILSGGQMTSASGSVGHDSANGTATVDGAGSMWTNSGELNVGRLGAGTLNVQNGGQVSNTNGIIGFFGNGSVTVTDVGSTWTSSGSVYVGGSAGGAGLTSSLMVQNDGAVNVANTLKIWSPGTLTVSGGSVTVGTGSAIADTLTIYSDGTLTIDGGAATTGSFDHTSGGTFNFNDGSLTVNGGTFDQGAVNLVLAGAGAGDLPTLNIINGATTLGVQQVLVGANNQAALNIQSGGGVTSTDTFFGVGSNGDGTATVDGSGSAWNSTSRLSVGESHNSTGTLTIQNGGAVSSASFWAGYSGMGTLDIQNGGVLTTTLSGYVGNLPTGVGVVTVSGAGSAWNNSIDLFVGYAGMGTLTVQNGGLVTNTRGLLGVSLDSNGAATVNGTGSAWDNSDILVVGSVGTGTLTVQNGGLVTNTFGYVGYDAGSNGTATVDGTGSLWTNTDSLYLGGNTSAAGGSGSLTVQNGGAVNVGDTLKIWSSGALTIDGGAVTTGSFELTDFTTFTFDDGSLTVDGGVFDQGAATLVLEGRGSGNLPTLNLINGATAANVQDVRIGNFNSGALNIQSGGQLSNARGFLGAGAGSGTATVDGAGSAWTNSGSLYIGGTNSAPGSAGTVTVQDNGALNVGDTLKIWGPGTLTINGGDVVTQHFDHTSGGTFTFRGGSLTVDGGTFDQGPANLVMAGFLPGDPPTLNVINGATTANVQQIRIGVLGPGALNILSGGQMTSASGSVGHDSANGTATVDGAGSMWTNSGELNVGRLGAGTLNVQNGGKVSNTNGIIGFFGNGTVTVDGSGSQWNNSDSLHVGGSAGGAGGSGSLTVADSGLVSVAETTKLWSGSSISLNSGGILDTQTLDLTAGSFEMLNGGTLHADAVIGDLANSSGVLAPGHSPGVMTVNGNYTQESLATLKIELRAATPDMFDQLVVTGDLSLDGSLQVSLIDDFAPAAGDAFDILDWGTLAATTFDTIELPELAGRIAWDTSELYTDGVIGVIGMLDGDTNIDWQVDDADYDAFVVVFGGVGDRYTDFNEDGRVDLADFAILRGNFGFGVEFAPDAEPGASTPEPATLSLLALGGIVLVRRRKRRMCVTGTGKWWFHEKIGIPNVRGGNHVLHFSLRPISI